jgi:hypothetical protein
MCLSKKISRAFWWFGLATATATGPALPFGFVDIAWTRRLEAVTVQYINPLKIIMRIDGNITRQRRA